jgi:hypothetical protein
MKTNKLKYKIYIAVTLLLLIIAQKSNSQVSITDSAINMHMVGAHYSMLWPGGDMADRFGRANAFGLTYAYKHHSNFYGELCYSFIWGNDVRETNMLDKIKTSSGNLIDNQGLLNPIDMELRGHSLFLGAGKVFPVIGPNPNSGFFLSMHGGFLQHKIRFNYVSKNIPQIQDDYTKGYDRLSNGFALKENIGYINLSNNNLLNWTLGFECIQAFTESRRDWNIDTQQKDTKRRVDLLFGFNLQIRMPFYKRAPQPYFYN